MRVLHIALTDGGGAGMGMMNQHRALRAMGVDSRVLVAVRRTDDPAVVQMQPNQYVWGNRMLQTMQRGLCRLGVTFNDYDKWHHIIYNVRKRHNVAFDNPFSQYDVLRHPLVAEADIVNLHYVSGFVDIPSFFRGIRKPVVWTMRDESLGLGGFHYREDRRLFYSHYAALEDSLLDIKRNAVNGCGNMHIVSLSRTMQRFCNEIDFLAQRPNRIIYNAISPDCYVCSSRRKARRELCLNDDDIIVSFVCCSLDERRKGLAVALDALRILDDRHIKLLCVGRTNGSIDVPGVVRLGTVSDSRRLSAVYSASDLFLNVSSQESFGKTIVEAMYCGTPVVSTPVGIAPEIMTARNGCLCARRTPHAIAQAIRTALAVQYDSTAIRAAAIEKFAPEKVAAQYASLYQSILSQ